ncbi:MAG: HD domain-containing phosphohydrolase [Acidobacteriota bacterium]
MSSENKIDSLAEDIDGFLRDFKKVKKKDRVPKKPWTVGGEADQDLASIFQNFQERISLKPGDPPDPDTGSLIDVVIDNELSEAQSQSVLSSRSRAQSLPEEDEMAAPDEPVLSAHHIYERASAYVAESIKRAGSDQLPDLEEGAELVGQMIDSMKEQSALLLIATEKVQPFSLGGHCVNVCILSLRMARTLKYSRGRCVQIGLTALLHEIGVARVAHQIESGVGDLQLEFRQRPLYSSDLLEKLGPEYDWLILAVGQVGEREDGSGYPLGLMGNAIREEAKIVGITDLLETCIHDRPYRKGVTSYQLLTEMSQSGKKAFSGAILKALIGTFSVYIYNEYVLLNTGEVGRVIEVNVQNLLRPRVEILYDVDGQAMDEPKEYDLVEYPSRFIAEALHPDDISLSE